MHSDYTRGHSDRMGKVMHFTISIPAALVAVALLLLNGREIAGAALERER